MGYLTVDLTDHVATVTFDRPPVNAVDLESLAEIRDTFSTLGDDRDVRAAILTAAGERAFMAGADLKSIDLRKVDGVPAWQVTDSGRLARDSFWAVYDCPIPVIAAVNGPAIGSGLGFVAVCDMILSVPGARFGTTEINVGLLGASAHLQLLVGRHRAREMFMTGELIEAEELHRIGAVRELVPRENLLTRARELAAVLAAKSPIALRLAKEAMNRVEFLPLKDAYRTEQDYTRRLITFEDAAEARQAFLEKRPADWKWR
jgi:enoyl-CoA hydratase